MFLQWMKVNKEYPEAKELTYIKFPHKFICKQVEGYDDTRSGKKNT